MKDYARRVPMARAHPAHAMAHIDPVDAARALQRAVVNGEHHRVALAKRHDVRARLHARPLLGEHEFAAGEVAPRLGKQDGELQREYMLAVQVLVQAVVVFGAVSQQERRRPALAGPVAAPDESRVLVRETRIDAQRRVPAIGHRRERWIERGAQRGDRLGQRIAEILVLAAPETVARHDYAAAKARLVRIQRSQGVAFLCGQQLFDDRAALGVQLASDLRPIDCTHARADHEANLAPARPLATPTLAFFPRSVLFWKAYRARPVAGGPRITFI